MQNNYNANNRSEQGQILCYRPYGAAQQRKQAKQIRPLTAILAAILVGLIIFSAVVIGAQAEKNVVTGWVLCQPGDYINVRMEPDKRSMAVGYLECGDSFETDGTCRNGFVRVMGIGETEGWIYAGYVVFEEPETVFENYACVARNRVACRRWVDGPQIKGRLGWLHTGSEVSVFYVAGGWAVTSRGFIRAEWLEV